jgi:sulfopyruvate decarboxylase subunit alpha
MNATEFCATLKSEGFNFFVGVPCSVLKEIIDKLSTDMTVCYVSATREEEAIGIAVGAYLGGLQPAVLMQNAGLGNSLGALTTLPLLYKIPLLLVISWRGYRGKDAPEHSVIGKSTLKLLKAVGIPAELLSSKNLDTAVARAQAFMCQQQSPAAILIKEGVIS